MGKNTSVVRLPGYVGSLQSVEQLSQELDLSNNASYQETVEALNRATQLIQSLPKYDVIGMDNLVGMLRHELINIQNRTDGIDSINKLSMKINVSRTHLSNFRDGGMVCMNIMNRLAAVFNIRYLVENYTDRELLID
ncbi:hypothetical protein ACFL2V_09245 [Pseudomonadota bacterium]